ncbi:MAG: UDP-3-O-(3-hydroxymyristoyl)glucosamine N-acyltransferase [Kiritimatiellae bacterium]|nr:UDP-3-O-(3-hydroxymyristoyl)glucosamine N-acyltransferase [Kiritimatiellia bacterium]
MFTAPKLTAAEVAEKIGAQLEGDGSVVLDSVGDLEVATPNQLAIAGGEHYLKRVPQCHAGALIVPVGAPVPEPHPALLRAQDMESAFIDACALFAPPAPELAPGVHPTAVIGEGAELGEGVRIGAYAVVEAGAKVGAGTWLWPHSYVGFEATIGENCVLYPMASVRERCVVGNRVILHNGVVIGSDGFGYRVDRAGVRTKIPQTGIVELGDDVEIGANSTVDRARFGVTSIGKGCKIDNLVQIAHNCVLGDHTVLCAQVGLAGTTTLGSHVICAGQAGLAGHIKVGDWTVVGAQAGVTKDLPPAGMFLGSPAIPRMDFGRQMACINGIPKMRAALKEIAEKLQTMEAAANAFLAAQGEGDEAEK